MRPVRWAGAWAAVLLVALGAARAAPISEVEIAGSASDSWANISVSRDGKKKVSHAYPLLVNNYVARAMNLAFEMGEIQITADVMMAI